MKIFLKCTFLVRVPHVAAIIQDTLASSFWSRRSNNFDLFFFELFIVVVITITLTEIIVFIIFGIFIKPRGSSEFRTRRFNNGLLLLLLILLMIRKIRRSVIRLWRREGDFHGDLMLETSRNDVSGDGSINKSRSSLLVVGEVVDHLLSVRRFVD